MTSRERVLAIIRHEPTDHLPLCFEGICHGAPRYLREQIPDPFARARYYLEREMDTAVVCNPPSLSPQHFQTRQWIEHPAGERYPVLHKEYDTPHGVLRQVVRKTEDYPEQVDLFSDHNVPSGRSLEYLVSAEQHLAPLAYLFQPPEDEQVSQYLEQARVVREFCDREQVLMAAHLPGVGDPLIWMCGVEASVFAALERPEFLQALIAIISRWNLRLLELAIEAGCQHIVRRGIYESTVFWSPALYGRFLLGPLQAETRMAHEGGLTLDYLNTAGETPLLSHYEAAGIDMLSNLDPLAPGADLVTVKQRLGGKVALCGGINNTLILEAGTPEQVREEVARAADLLGSGGGYIMAPSDGPGYIVTTDTVRRNCEVMVEAWRAIR